MTLFDIKSMAEGFASFLILASMAIAVIFIVWGAMLYISAGDDYAKAEMGKTRIIKAITGAFVILAVGLIIITLASLVS